MGWQPLRRGFPTLRVAGLKYTRGHTRCAAARRVDHVIVTKLGIVRTAASRHAAAVSFRMVIMGSKLGMLRKRSRGGSKTASVRKLSPEQPAARDEGPRLIPLGPNKDASLGRIEHYLELADRALGHSPAAQHERPVGVAVPAANDFRAEREDTIAEAPTLDSAPPEPAPALSLPPLPPRLNLPRPPRLPKPPEPPKLMRAMPPKAPRFPKPPKLSLPKPPGRRNAASSRGKNQK